MKKQIWVAAISVVVGTSSIPAAVFAAASDFAGNPPYADSWQDGDNGGSGFAPWTSAFSGDAGVLMHGGPKFIDTLPALPGNSLGTPAFGLTTSARPSFFDTSEVIRRLSTPMTVGQQFHIDVDGSALDPAAPGFSIGNTVQLLNSAGTERFGFFTNNQFLNDNWVATGNADSGVPAGSSFHLAFTLVTPNTYNLVVRPVSGGAPLFTQTNAMLAGPAGTPIDRIRITAYGTGSSANGSTELFFNNLLIAVPEPSSLVILSLGSMVCVALTARRR
jgi:hypothetical protein